MATGDDDADRFRVPRWISDDNSDDGELAERARSTEQPYDGETYIPRAATPSLNTGEPLWPAALPPPVTRGQRKAAEPQRRGLIIVAAAAAAAVVVVIVAVGLLIHGMGGDDKRPTAAAPPVPAQSSGNTTQEAPSTAPTTGGPSTAPTTGGQGSTFGPLTIEAEADGNSLIGSARVIDYPNASGGRVVRNIGDWQTDAGPGTLRFNNVDVPRSGNYTLAFSYVDIDNEANRTAVIDISGRTGMVVTVNGTTAAAARRRCRYPCARAGTPSPSATGPVTPRRSTRS